MIREYRQIQALDIPSDNCTVYKVKKDNQLYLMHEFDSPNEFDEYSFKMRKKLSDCKHIGRLVEDFVEKDHKYYISEYMEGDLLKEILSHPGHLLELSTVLKYTAGLIEAIQELINRKVVYRNIRPQKIRLKDNKLFLFDFSMSQVIKRRQRMFDVVGCLPFLAPQFFSEDGYGFEVDIWAVVVLLHYMLCGAYPFQFKSEDEATVKQQFRQKCEKGFRLQVSEKRDFQSQQQKKAFQDFFKKMFILEPNRRLSLSEIKQHKLFAEFFPNQLQVQLAVITQGSGQSIFLSKIRNFSCCSEFYREEIVLDFIQRSAESLMIDCAECIPEIIRLKAQFAVLKIGMLRYQRLIEVFYGKREPEFSINSKEWQQIRNSTALIAIRQKLQKKQKILQMLFRSAKVRLGDNEKERFFEQKLPSDFNEIKIDYRHHLNEMFEYGKHHIRDIKERKKARKIIECLVRLIILHLVNRIFDSQTMKQDFIMYFEYSKKESLEDLEAWIEGETSKNLTVFMKFIAVKYL